MSVGLILEATTLTQWTMHLSTVTLQESMECGVQMVRVLTVTVEDG